jgi:hypothetical protein
MTIYVDNQPNYLTSTPPPLRQMRFDVLARGEVIYTDEDDYCEPTKQTFLVEIREANGDVRDFKHLLSRALSPNRCYCEHDCCGHRHGFADVRLFDFDRAEVTVYTARNF